MCPPARSHPSRSDDAHAPVAPICRFRRPDPPTTPGQSERRPRQRFGTVRYPAIERTVVSASNAHTAGAVAPAEAEVPHGGFLGLSVGRGGWVGRSVGRSVGIDPVSTGVARDLYIGPSSESCLRSEAAYVACRRRRTYHERRSATTDVEVPLGFGHDAVEPGFDGRRVGWRSTWPVSSGVMLRVRRHHSDRRHEVGSGSQGLHSSGSLSGSPGAPISAVTG